MAALDKIPFVDDEHDDGVNAQVPFLSGYPQADADAPVPFLQTQEAVPKLQRPQDPGPAPDLNALPMIGDETPLGRFAQPILPAPPEPTVVTPSVADRQQQRGSDEAKLERIHDAEEKLQAPHLGQPGSRMPGWGGKILHGLAQGLDVAGDVFLGPEKMSYIPGTNEYRTASQRNLNREESDYQDDIAKLDQADLDETQKHEADARANEEELDKHELSGAQTDEAKAHADELRQSKPDPDRAKTITTDKGVMQWNPKTNAYDIPAGSSPKEQTPEQQAFDSLIAGGMTPAAAFEKLHPKLYASGGEGTWQLAEDANGKPILFNSKTGTQRDSGGMQRSGTAAKEEAAAEKKNAANAPVEAALTYANDYLNNGVFTGSGDEALQEKFFELAKPSTGFRMTQPQIDMLQNARSWMSSGEAHWRHMTTGTWFSPEQRKEIVATMQQLHDAKMKAAGGVGTQGGPKVGDVENGYRFKGGDPSQSTNWEKVTK